MYKASPIKDICMVFYSNKDMTTKTASECLDDSFPSVISSEKGKWTPQAWKFRHLGHENGYDLVNPGSLGDAYTATESLEKIIPEDGLALVRDCHEHNSPIVVYSQKSYHPNELNTGHMSEFLGELEKRLPALYNGVMYSENGSQMPMRTTSILRENGQPPSKIHTGNDVLYPVIKTNETCCYEGGNFTKVNGDCSGSPAKMKNLDSPESIGMLMIDSMTPGTDVVVYMPEKELYKVQELRDPGSKLRSDIYKMHRHLMAEKT